MDIIDIFVIIALVIFFVIVIIGMVYTMVYFQHPDDDTNECIWLYRISVVSSFSLAVFLTVVQPLDASATDREDSANLGLNMNLFWNAMMGFILLITWTILPASILIYQSDPEKPKGGRIAKGVIVPILLIIASVIVIVIMKFGFGHSNLSWEYNKINFNKAKLSNDQTTLWGTTASSALDFQMTLGWFNGVMCYLSVFGSFLWCCIGGFGLANLPIMLINSWLNKPEYKDAEDYTFTRLILRAENEELIEEAKNVKKEQMEYNKATGFNQRRKMVFALRRHKNQLREKFLKFEEVMIIFKEEEDPKQSNPLVYVFHLIAGNIALLLSMGIVCHSIGNSVKKADGQPISSGMDGAMSNISLYLHFVVASVLFVAF